MTGLSQVNFDIQSLGDEEEEQLDKEDAERERELHELLSSELPEDLLDDDNISFTSPGQSASTHTPEYEVDNSYSEPQQILPSAQDHLGSKRADYPQLNQISMLLTQRGEEFIQRFATSSSPDKVYHPNPESLPGTYSGGNNEYCEDSGEYIRTDEDHQGPYAYHDVDDASLGSDEYIRTDKDHQGPYAYHDVDDVSLGSGEYNHDDGDIYDHSNLQDYDGTTYDMNFNAIQYSNNEKQQGTSDADMIDNFTVEYKRGATVNITPSQHEAIQNEAILGNTSVSPSTVELAQLQILHRARKRKLEELTKEMECKEREYERRTRVLKHQLAMMKGERDGMEESLKHAQDIAMNRQKEIDELEHKLHNADCEKERMNGERSEVEGELESARKTIESLHQQLMHLERSESVSRAREQHENVIAATKKRHEEDAARFKQKLDDLNNKLLWKEEESKRLQDELAEARKESDRLRLDRAETVNRLTKGLEESQRQNEELLNSGSSQEIFHLQRQLNHTQLQKESLETRYKTLETDLVDLKEQLGMYDMMSKLGETSRGDDIKRNLGANEWRTPVVHRGNNESKLSVEDTLASLQQELRQSLSSNRSKREEIDELRNKFDAAQNHLNAKENEVERLELLVKKQEIRVLEQEKKISEIEELNKIPELGDRNRDDKTVELQYLVQEQNLKLEQCLKREKDLEQLNQQLKSQMSEMVRDYDTDKQKSIEQCRESCLEFHDQAMTKMKQELLAEHEEEQTKLKRDLEAVTKELDQVKESYVALSEESRWIEKETRESCEQVADQRTKEMKSKWEEEKTCELLELRQTLAEEIERTLEKERAVWKSAEDERMKETVNTELALAKMDWKKDEQLRREEAIENAVTKAEKEWGEKYGVGEEFQEILDKKIEQLKQEWNYEKKQEIEKKLSELRLQLSEESARSLKEAHDKWMTDRTAELENELKIARRRWKLELAQIVKQSEESAIEKARADWLKERADDERKSKRTDDVIEVVESAKKNWEREKDVVMMAKVEELKRLWEEEKEKSITEAVLRAEEKWHNDHSNKLNDAVKVALELAEDSWRKEKESAIESAVSQSLRAAKETWNENKIKEMEQILSNSRKQWLNEMTSEQDINKTFGYLEAQYSKNLKEFREGELARALEEHGKSLRNAIREQEIKYESNVTELERKHKEQIDNLTKKSEEDRDAELRDLETEYQNKLSNIVDDVEEKWRQKKTALEEEIAEKMDQQRLELQTSYREKYQKERESLGRHMREKYEKGVENARKKLEYQFKEKLRNALECAKNDWETEQEEDRIAVEEQHMKELEHERAKLRNTMEHKLSEACEENLMKIGDLEEQIKKGKERYKTDIEILKNEVEGMKIKRSLTENNDANMKRLYDNKSTQSDTDQPYISLTELPEDTPNYERLNTLRRQYLATTEQMKDDLMKHAMETRNNAVKAIRSEVLKERHSTAKQLRKHYLECLKQILDEDKQAYQNNRPTKSNEEKLKILNERLRLPGENDDNRSSYESTLTTVTAVPDTTSEDHDDTKGNDHIHRRSLKKSCDQRREKDVSKTSARPPKSQDTLRKHEDGSFTRGIKYEREWNPKLQRKDKESREDCSSFESLDIDLPPLIDLWGQSSVEAFQQAGVNTSSSGSSGLEREKSVDGYETTQKPTLRVYNTSYPSIGGERQPRTHSNDGAAAHSLERVTHRKNHETQRNSSEKRSKLAAHVVSEYMSSSQEKPHEKTKLRHGKEPNIHSNDRKGKLDSTEETGSNIQCKSTTMATGMVSRRAIKTHSTQSPCYPVDDVLPSKPLSPVRQSPHVHSFTLYSQRNK